MKTVGELHVPLPRGFDPIPGSLVDLHGGGRAMLARCAEERRLLITGPADEFGGEQSIIDGQEIRVSRLTPAAAGALRRSVPWLRPRPLGVAGSFGFGDRIGFATPGHISSLVQTGASLLPVFAQQSVRELTRTGRTFQEVLDAAMWGVLEGGWRRGYGADADHLKSTDDVAAAVAAGYTMFTLDPSEVIARVPDHTSQGELERCLERLPWRSIEDDWRSMRLRYLARCWPVAGATIGFDESELATAVVRYGGAIALLRLLAETARDAMGPSHDLELSIDEMPVATTVRDHLFVGLELRRLGVRWTSFAPRLPGRWEKAVDWEGNPAELRAAVKGHLAVADMLGDYKLAIHSGSDKFSAYPTLSAASGGRLHVKTSGTSYLEALRVAAVEDADLFRRVARLARSRFGAERVSYGLSTADAFSDLESTLDGELSDQLDRAGERQCLHVTFGAVLCDQSLGPELIDLLTRRRARFDSTLEQHFSRHLTVIGANAAAA
jgi:hypothetical protein